MPRFVIINGKRVPIPVPVRTLLDVIDWVENTLVPKNHSITRVRVDERTIDYNSEEIPSLLLNSKSEVSLQVDSPYELALQTLEAIKNLSSVVFSTVKHLAVECWQCKPVDKPTEIEALLEDLELIVELFHHLGGIITLDQKDEEIFVHFPQSLTKTLTALEMAKCNSDWRAVARLLLNRLEPNLLKIEDYMGTVQRALIYTGSRRPAKVDAL